MPYSGKLMRLYWITSTKAEILVMNSKNEWHQAPIVRVVASAGLHGDQGEDQAPTLADRGEGGSQGEEAGKGGEGGELRGPADHFKSIVVLINPLFSVV